MLDMLEMWKGSMLNEQKELLPKNSPHYSDNSMQTSFTLPEGAKVVFTNSRKTLKPVKNYDDLNEVELTENEKSIVKLVSEDILNQPFPNNYDGDHLLISAVLYDHEKNTLYIEAKKAKYSLLVSLNRKKFPKDSPIIQQDLYGAGVHVPLITEKDSYTVLLQSSKYRKDNFLTVSGFVDAASSDTLLAYPNGTSIIEKIAAIELGEELLWDENSELRIAYKLLNISSLLFRKPVDGRGFVEFIVPAKLNCNRHTLEHVIKTNKAPDRNEHTGFYKLINLDPAERHADGYSFWSKNTPGGRDQYPRDVSEASRCNNKKLYGDVTQRYMPAANGQAFPVSFFRTNLNRELSISMSSEKNIKAFEFKDFSDEMKLRIFNFLNSKDLSIISTVSKKWEALTKDKLLWKEEKIADNKAKFFNFEESKSVKQQLDDAIRNYKQGNIFIDLFSKEDLKKINSIDVQIKCNLVSHELKKIIPKEKLNFTLYEVLDRNTHKVKEYQIALDQDSTKIFIENYSPSHGIRRAFT